MISGRSTAALAAVLMFAAGCSFSGSSGGVAAPAVEMDLKEVADLLRAASQGKPPTKASDLTRFQSVATRGFQVVSSGDIVVVWGAKMAGEGDAASGTGPKGVIAYEKTAPLAGGYVLLQDGTVKELTTEEFQAADKAK